MGVNGMFSQATDGRPGRACRRVTKALLMAEYGAVIRFRHSLPLPIN